MQLIEPFLILFIAHLVGDFVFQTEQMALKKAHVLSWLFLHAFELGLITWLLCWSAAVWKVVLVVFLTHVVFDWIKPRLKGDPIYWYIVDQTAHIIVLWLCAWWIVHKTTMFSMPLTQWIAFKWQACIAAYLLVGRPLTIGIGLFLKPWQNELANPSSNNNGNEPITGLTQSSEWIGYFERVFTLTCSLIGQYILIAGLMITKGIFRIGELSKSDQRKRTDYVIVGTFASITLAMIVGVLTHFVISLQ